MGTRGGATPPSGHRAPLCHPRRDTGPLGPLADSTSPAYVRCVSATRLEELDLPFFDDTEPGLVGETFHQRLAQVRDQGWLARSPLAYVVLDRDSGEFFLRAKQTSFPGREIADLFGITDGRLREMIDNNILNLTGARHRRLRALVGPAFSPRAAERWRPRMREFLDDLWQALGTAQTCEFVAAFAKPYPSLTIAAVLGAPKEDAARLHEWSGWVQRQFDITALSSEPDKIEKAVVDLYDYVENLLEQRRSEPSHDTTQAQLSHALKLFAAHPRQWATLADHPEWVPNAVEEVLRFEPITPFTAMLCTSQIVHRGVIFPQGTIVAICAERANRDLDTGGAFDITAERDERLLTFGAGAHFCLGANLARAELEEALTFLAPRMLDLRPAGPEQLGGVQGIYNIESLPLAWSAPNQMS